MTDITENFIGIIIGRTAHQNWIIVKIMPDDPTGMPVRIFALWDLNNPIPPLLGMRVWCAPARIPTISCLSISLA